MKFNPLMPGQEEMGKYFANNSFRVFLASD